MPEHHLEDLRLPFFLWLRLITGQKLATLHRHHLGVKARDARRDISIYSEGMPEASSDALTMKLLDTGTSPDGQAIRAEARSQVQKALDQMDPVDREVLVLRHFEELSNQQAAQILNIKEPGASLRYVRALERLREILKDVLSSGGAL